MDSADVPHHAFPLPDLHALAVASYPAPALDRGQRFSPTVSTIHIKRVLVLHHCRVSPELRHFRPHGFWRQVAFQQAEHRRATSSVYQCRVAVLHRSGVLVQRQPVAAVFAPEMDEMARAARQLRRRSEHRGHAGRRSFCRTTLCIRRCAT